MTVWIKRGATFYTVQDTEQAEPQALWSPIGTYTFKVLTKTFQRILSLDQHQVSVSILSTALTEKKNKPKPKTTKPKKTPKQTPDKTYPLKKPPRTTQYTSCHFLSLDLALGPCSRSISQHMSLANPAPLMNFCRRAGEAISGRKAHSN